MAHPADLGCSAPRGAGWVQPMPPHYNTALTLTVSYTSSESEAL